MNIRMDPISKLTYKGIAITIKRRIINEQPDDWGYRTSNGISGIGQYSAADAEACAKQAIDTLERKP